MSRIYPERKLIICFELVEARFDDRDHKKILVENNSNDHLRIGIMIDPSPDIKYDTLMQDLTYMHIDPNETKTLYLQ